MEIVRTEPAGYARSVSDDRCSFLSTEDPRSGKKDRFRRLWSASTAASSDAMFNGASSPTASDDYHGHAGHASPSRDVDGAATLTKPLALELQSELLAEFSSPSFLKAKHTLVREHSVNTLACRAALTKLVRARQMDVLPRYGFDSSPEGVESMLRAFKKLEKDPDIYVNSVAIQDALSLSSASSGDLSAMPEPDLVTKPTTNHRVCELLRALLVEFSMASFQQDVDDLKRKAGTQRRRMKGSSEDPDGYYHLPGRSALALQVYRMVLPCFGHFIAGPQSLDCQTPRKKNVSISEPRKVDKVFSFPIMGMRQCQGSKRTGQTNGSLRQCMCLKRVSACCSSRCWSRHVKGPPNKIESA